MCIYIYIYINAGVLLEFDEREKKVACVSRSALFSAVKPFRRFFLKPAFKKMEEENTPKKQQLFERSMRASLLHRDETRTENEHTEHS